MSANAAPAPLPNSPGPFPVEIPQVAQSSSLWDRITNWASENKGTVYAIAGVTLVVTAAGTIYYLNSDSNKDAPSPGATSTNKRKNKRDRKKAKERAEKEAAKEETKPGRRSSQFSRE
jgi:import receptor subunit TOM70